MENKVKEKIYEIVKNYTDEDFAFDVDLKNTIGLDYIDIYEIILECEEEFEIEIEDDFFSLGFKTAQDLFDIIMTKIKKG